MTAKDLFGVVVRTIGFIFVIFGLRTMLQSFATSADYFPRPPFADGLAEFGLGVVAFVAVDFIVALAYRRKSADESNDQEPS